MAKAKTRKEQADPAQQMAHVLCAAFISAYVRTNGSALEQTEEWKASKVNEMGSSVGWLEIARDLLKLGVRLP